MQPSQQRFEGRTLIATGAASGIGAATAQLFAQEGGRVAFVDRDGDGAAALAAQFEGSFAIACDVSDEESVAETVATVSDRFGGIDCLLNCAGVADFGPIEEWSLQRWNRLLGVHAGGTFLLCKNVVPLMRAVGRGSIVNVASISAFIAQPNNAPYGAAKSAIVGFSRQLARDVAPAIRVNVIAPGRVLTGMTEPLFVERGGGDGSKGKLMGSQLNVQKRVASPEEIARPACFLLSEDASFITGSVLFADGGETAI